MITHLRLIIVALQTGIVCTIVTDDNNQNVEHNSPQLLPLIPESPTVGILGHTHGLGERHDVIEPHNSTQGIVDWVEV